MILRARLLHEPSAALLSKAPLRFWTVLTAVAVRPGKPDHRGYVRRGPGVARVPVRLDRPRSGPIFQAGRAAAMCSNQADLHLTLTDPKNGPELPQRPSMTCMRLVCI